MKLFSKIRDNLFSIFQTALIGLLVVLVVVFVVVMIPDCPKWIFNLLGIAGTEEPKYEALKFLGIGMGGILIALQALMSYRRAKAMEGTAESQAKATEEQAKANQHTEEGQRQERLKNAIEHLGHKSDSVRIGGAYELFHLVEDAENRELRRMVFNILCAHICRTTGERKYRETYESKPSAEIQSLLTLLFVQEHKVFKGCHINLQGSWLNGADLKEARLEEAVLTEVYMRRAILDDAQLQGASLDGAQLQGAWLQEAHMQGVTLNRAHMQGIMLGGAQLQGAWLQEAHIQGAWLDVTKLQGTILAGAQLQGATLDGAQLQGAQLRKAHMQGIRVIDLSSTESFEDCIREQIDKKCNLPEVAFEGGLSLPGVIFAGGLSQEDVDSLVEGMSDEKANMLRRKLKSHIGQPESNQLMEDSGAIIGSYTKEEAEKWIAEYKKAMSEIPGDDS